MDVDGVGIGAGEIRGPHPSLGRFCSSCFRVLRLSTAWTPQGPMNAMGDLTSCALLGGWLFGQEMSKSQSKGVEQAKEDLRLVCLSIAGSVQGKKRWAVKGRFGV